jgi:hypothetical protein
LTSEREAPRVIDELTGDLDVLDSSWEVTFVQLEVEHGLELEAASLVASQLVPSSSKGRI